MDDNINVEQNLISKLQLSVLKSNYLLKILIKKWWLIILISFLGGVVGFLYANSQKPNYKSRLTFALDEGGNTGTSGVFSIAAQFGINIGGGKDIFSGDNITEIIKSRRMIERVLLSVDTFNNKPYTLIEYYLEQTKSKTAKTNIVHFLPGQSKSSLSFVQDSVLYKVYLGFLDLITAEKPDKRLGIYEVSITTPDERFTKIFTDRIVAETNKFYTEIRTKKSKETLEILEERVNSMKENLGSSITSRAASQDVNLNPAFSTAQVPVIKQQANIQVYSAAYAEMFKNLELARFQYLNEIPLMQIIDFADYPMQKIKLSRLKTAIIFSVISGALLVIFFWLKYNLRDKYRILQKSAKTSLT